MENYDFFKHRTCEYFPCHAGADPETFSCLFCYCALYCLGVNCGGNFRYSSKGIKDCSACLVPHQRENYKKITAKMDQVLALVKKSPEGV